MNNLLIELSNVLKVQSEKGEKKCENYAGIRILYYVLFAARTEFFYFCQFRTNILIVFRPIHNTFKYVQYLSVMLEKNSRMAEGYWR